MKFKQLHISTCKIVHVGPVSLSAWYRSIYEFTSDKNSKIFTTQHATIKWRRYMMMTTQTKN